MPPSSHHPSPLPRFAPGACPVSVSVVRLPLCLILFYFFSSLFMENCPQAPWHPSFCQWEGLTAGTSQAKAGSQHPDRRSHRKARWATA